MLIYRAEIRRFNTGLWMRPAELALGCARERRPLPGCGHGPGHAGHRRAGMARPDARLAHVAGRGGRHFNRYSIRMPARRITRSHFLISLATNSLNCWGELATI